MALFDKLFGKKKDGEGDESPPSPATVARRFSLASGRVLPDPAAPQARSPSGRVLAPGADPAADADTAAPNAHPEDDDMLADFPLAGADDEPSAPAGTGDSAAMAPPTSDTVRHLPGTPSAPPPPAPVPSHKVRVSAPNKTLGALLVAAGTVTDEQVDEALDRQEGEGGLLGRWLRDLGYAQPEDIASALGRQRTITTVRLARVPVDEELKIAFPRAFCLKNRVLPFERFGGSMVCVAMTNVLDSAAKNLVRERASAMVKPFDADWADLQAAIDRWHGAEASDLRIELPGEGGLDYDNRQARRIAAIKKAEAAPAPSPEEARAVEALRLHALPDDVMPAIPLTESYAAEVVQWNRADPEQRWLATHLADNVLPLLPAIDLPDTPVSVPRP